MKTLFYLSITILFLAIFNPTAFGASKVSAKSGPYGFASTWTDGIAPVAGDDIFIQEGHSVGGATGPINNLTVHGDLTYSGLTVTGALQVGSSGSMGSLSGGFQLFLKGPSIHNDGSINTQTRINGETGQTISGGGVWTAGGEFTGAGEKTINNMIVPSGLWSVLRVVHVGGTWRFTGGSAGKPSTGIVKGNGSVLYEKDGGLSSNESTGNLWTVPITILARVAVTATSSVSAPIFIGNTGTLSVSIHQVFEARSDFTVELGGQVMGQTVKLSGVNIINNGDIHPVDLFFNRAGNQAISGSGLWRTIHTTTIGGSGEKSLVNSISTSVGSLVITSALNINEHTLTFNAGRFIKSQTGSVSGMGKIIFKANGDLFSDESTGNRFTAPVEINSGTRVVEGGFSAPITIEEGATLWIAAHRTLNARDDLTLKPGSFLLGQTLAFFGVNLINHGTISPVLTIFKSGSHVLSGNGSFGNTAEMQTGSSTVLQGVMQFQTLTLRSGSSFDIRNSTLKIGMNFSNSGAVITDGSTIEYNRGNGDQNLLTNIAYHNLVINNPQQVFLNSPETVENILRLERGIFEISTNRLTIGNCGQIIYAGGTLNGTPIFSSCEQSFAVTNQNDSGPGSLRQAIIDANANTGHDTIFLKGLTGTIALTSGALPISESVTIRGPGADNLTLSGENSNQIFVISRQSDSGSSPFVVNIKGLTLANGYSNDCGGAIHGLNVEMSLDHVAVTGSTSINGGGVCFGGGILNVSNSLVGNNKALSGSGGGIHIQNAETVNIINSTVSENEANVGGGISLNSGTANIVNSTVSHNNAASSGGGISNEGTVNIRNSIVAANQARVSPDLSGIFNSLGNNLIGASDDNQGFIDGLNGDKAGTTATPIDPKLGNLQDNGGPTKTRSLLAGSPAAEAGNNCVTTAVDSGGCMETPLSNDQRGPFFPRLVGSAVDIGAFEASVVDPNSG